MRSRPSGRLRFFISLSSRAPSRLMERDTMNYLKMLGLLAVAAAALMAFAGSTSAAIVSRPGGGCFYAQS
jgi:hypothetical protein